MNLLLLLPSDFIDAETVELEGRRAEHMRTILKTQIGDTVKVGLLNGNTGKACVVKQEPNKIRLKVHPLTELPPSLLPLKLILGLPRPRVLHRLLQTVTALGVAELHLLQTARVEKSYWQTPLLAQTAVEEQLHLGLEQAKATQPPKVFFHKRFIPFMEDELSLLTKDRRKILAHPSPNARHIAANNADTVLAIGPEGGFIEKETQLFERFEFEALNFGARILKTETAVPYAIAKIFN